MSVMVRQETQGVGGNSGMSTEDLCITILLPSSEPITLYNNVQPCCMKITYESDEKQPMSVSLAKSPGTMPLKFPASFLPPVDDPLTIKLELAPPEIMQREKRVRKAPVWFDEIQPEEVYRDEEYYMDDDDVRRRRKRSLTKPKEATPAPVVAVQPPHPADDSETELDDDMMMHKKKIKKSELSDLDKLWNKTRASVGWRWEYLQHKMAELESKLEAEEYPQLEAITTVDRGTHPLYSIKAPYFDWMNEALPKMHKTPTIDIPPKPDIMTPIRPITRCGETVDQIIEVVTPNIATPRWKRVESTADLLLIRSMSSNALPTDIPAPDFDDECTPCSDTRKNDGPKTVEDDEEIDILKVEPTPGQCTLSCLNQMNGSTTTIENAADTVDLDPYSDVVFAKRHFQLEFEERRKFVECWLPDTKSGRSMGRSASSTAVGTMPSQDRSAFLKLPVYSDPLKVIPRRFEQLRASLGFDAPRVVDDPVRMAMTKARKRLLNHLHTQHTRLLVEKRRKEMALAEQMFQRSAKKKKRVTFDIKMENSDNV